MGRCRNWLSVVAWLLLTLPGEGQAPSVNPSADSPLPDIPALMRQVEAHQRDDEARLRNYIFRQTQTLAQSNGHGGVKKQEVRAFDVFWLDGVPVQKMVSKDGRPLSADDLRKEDERIDKEVRKVKDRRAKNDSKGEETDPLGHEEITVSRILELGSFTHPRRVSLNGRNTIAVEYAGDPHAKTRNRAEEVIRDLAGTLWIDEQDREIVRTEGRFFRPFKIGGGLVANIHEGTSFSMQQAKINNDVWLPTDLTATGAARFLLLFSFDGNIHIVDTDFRRFKTTSTLLPGVGKVDDTQP